MPIFETVADEYDRARPDYPPGVYEALGALEGLTVLDVGAGTGIATRELLRRGASVIAIDPGSAVLARAAARTRDLVAVAADGAARATVAASGLFEVSGRVTIPWLREITVEDWLTDQLSHSYVAALPAPERRRLVARLRALLDGEFHSGLMAIPYETWLWIASKR